MCQSYKTVRSLFHAEFLMDKHTDRTAYGFVNDILICHTILNTHTHTLPRQCCPSLSLLAHNRAIIFIKVVREMRAQSSCSWMRWNAQRQSTLTKNYNWAQTPTYGKSKHPITKTTTIQSSIFIGTIKIDENSESFVQFVSTHRSKFMVISALNIFIFRTEYSKPSI